MLETLTQYSSGKRDEGKHPAETLLPAWDILLEGLPSAQSHLSQIAA